MSFGLNSEELLGSGLASDITRNKLDVAVLGNGLNGVSVSSTGNDGFDSLLALAFNKKLDGGVSGGSIGPFANEVVAISVAVDVLNSIKLVICGFNDDDS